MIGGPAFSAKNAVPAGARLVPDPSIQGWHRPLLCREATPVCHLLGTAPSGWLGLELPFHHWGRGDLPRFGRPC